MSEGTTATATAAGAGARTDERRTTRLRRLIRDPSLRFLMEAHNGLSARIVEESGFDGVWASGLSISAALGVRDRNEASWTQVLEVVEFMADATRLPILVDGDTGYGDFNSMRRLVGKLCQRGAAGVCVEDKLFPKTNSFLHGNRQPLADADEFAGKIKAGRDAAPDDDFCIVARCEALIAGWGVDEALRRAELYRQAGADAILIHSAKRTADEVLAFKRRWGNRLPVVIVPTKYYSTPTELFRDAGFSLVIWANHLMRASLAAMQRTARRIAEEQTLLNVEEEVAPLAEVFRLQGEDELAEAEKRYRPAPASTHRAVLLAASRGEELAELTLERPKAMVPVGDKPLLARVVDAYRGAGVRDVTAVRGYRKESFVGVDVHFVDNDRWAETAEVGSLARAMDALGGPCLVAYGDVLLKKYIVEELMEAEDPFVIAVDVSWRQSRNAGRVADWVQCSQPPSKRASLTKTTLRRFPIDEREIDGEWMGVLKLSANGTRALRELLVSLAPERRDALRMPQLLELVVEAGHEVRVFYTSGHWLDVDSVDDLVLAGSF